jgi:hypothetical protein
VRVDGKADVGGLRPHFDGQGAFGDQVAGVRPDNPGANNAFCPLVEYQPRNDFPRRPYCRVGM